MEHQSIQIGQLAHTYCNKKLPLEIMRSNAGFYIGTSDGELPCSRESVEYFRTRDAAEQAIESGSWTQKEQL